MPLTHVCSPSETETLVTDEDAEFDHEVTIDASALAPYVTWGTNPAQSVSIDGVVPDPASFASVAQQQAAQRALDYMGLAPGTAADPRPRRS